MKLIAKFEERKIGVVSDSFLSLVAKVKDVFKIVDQVGHDKTFMFKFCVAIPHQALPFRCHISSTFAPLTWITTVLLLGGRPPLAHFVLRVLP